MKSIGFLKLAVTLLGFGAVLVFTPSCRAQSEIDPDHFDGSDSWEVAAKAPAPHALHSSTTKNQQVKNKSASAASTLQLASERQLSTPQRHDAVAIQDKRKPAVRKPEKQ